MRLMGALWAAGSLAMLAACTPQPSSAEFGVEGSGSCADAATAPGGGDMEGCLSDTADQGDAGLAEARSAGGGHSRR